MLVVGRADDDDPAAQAEDVDRSAVERGQCFRREHLVGRAHRPASGREVEHAIDDRENRVDVVRDEDDRRAGAAPVRVEEAGDDLLVGEVEREERLVGKQERRARDERLRDAKPLLLAAREASERRIGVAACSNRLDGVLEAIALPRREPSRAESVAVETEAHEIAAAQRQVAIEDSLLRDVADP